MKPNVVFVFADQWRGQTVGYAGDSNAKTPNIDKLAEESMIFTNAISGCPVCSPYRASLMTGQYPLTHGVFLNDVNLNPDSESIAKVYKMAGYDTAYIGKWHIDGSGDRSGFIPKERRQGFDFWKVMECTHRYLNSQYWDNDDTKKTWEGYDVIAQTDAAIEYIKNRTKDEEGKPFFLMLSWGPPHNPYQDVPKKYLKMFNRRKIKLNPNVPKKSKRQATKDLCGYYAHIAAMDECVCKIISALKNTGLEKETIFVLTSDHGDMHGAHGFWRKQWPYSESVNVPFLIYAPYLGISKKRINKTIFDAPDIMPTLLDLCKLNIPSSVEGTNYSESILKPNNGKKADQNDFDGKLIASYWPFGEWKKKEDGREYRGIKTPRYTYIITLDGPWLLFDNRDDPYQLKNLCNNPKYAGIQEKLDQSLKKLIEKYEGKFRPGKYYLKKWDYETRERDGAVPYIS